MDDLHEYYKKVINLELNKQIQAIRKSIENTLNQEMLLISAKKMIIDNDVENYKNFKDIKKLQELKLLLSVEASLTGFYNNILECLVKEAKKNNNN